MKEHMAERDLQDLSGIGPAMLRDFRLLGIRSVEQLAKKDAKALYERLGRLTGVRQDPCVLDTFTPHCPAPFGQGRFRGVVPPSENDSWERRHTCAVAQARDPRLPAAQRDWWYWSRVRKAGHKP